MDEQYRANYASLYHHHWWWRAREEELLRELRQLRAGREFGRVLDVGCGDGLFLDRLMEFGEVAGIEPDPKLVSPESLARHRIHVGVLDGSFPDKWRFDLILFLDVLEHLDDPALALMEAAKRLTIGGRIVVTVPAYRVLWTAHDVLNEHRTRYSPKGLTALASMAGLQVVRMRHLFHWLAIAKLITRAGEAILGTSPSPPRIPPMPLNRVLLWLCRVDHRIGAAVRLPFGSSLFAELRTP